MEKTTTVAAWEELQKRVDDAEAALERVLALVDGWMEGYGPGTKVWDVMGDQVISVPFIHEQVHKASKGEE